MYRILGVDPGFGKVGVAIIEGSGQNWKAIHYECIHTSTQKTYFERIYDIAERLNAIIDEFEPSIASVEELFFKKNTKTAKEVFHARGVIVHIVYSKGLRLFEYTPSNIKSAIAGDGKADKKKMQHMVALSLNLEDKNIQDDAADALAAALTCGLQLKINGF